MAQWPIFYTTPETPSNLVYGMYDLYLLQLETGPSQAERVLYHTPMMDLAHERRFVISERQSSMPEFEVEHPTRIRNYAVLLESIVNDDSIADDSFSEIEHDSPVSSIVEDDFRCMGATLHIHDTYPRLHITEEFGQRRDSTSSKPDVPSEAISVDDSDSSGHEFDESLARAITEASRQSRIHPSTKVRQQKMVRSRRAPIAMKPSYEAAESRRRLSVGFLLSSPES